MSFGSRWALIVYNWYSTAINWWIMPPIFLVVAPNFADETNSQFPLGVDWCAHHQDSEHASQTEDRSWILELNLSPPNRWAKMPLHFLGTLIDWGVCVFLIVYVCFRLDATYSDRLSLFWWFLDPTLQVGLGCNKIPLQQIDFHSLHASYGLGWNLGIAAADEVLTEALTTTDLHWDRLVSDAWSELVPSWASMEDWEETLLVIHGFCSLRLVTIYISPSAAQNIPPANMGMSSPRNKGSCIYIYGIIIIDHPYCMIECIYIYIYNKEG